MDSPKCKILILTEFSEIPPFAKFDVDHTNGPILEADNFAGVAKFRRLQSFLAIQMSKQSCKTTTTHKSSFTDRIVDRGKSNQNTPNIKQKKCMFNHCAPLHGKKRTAPKIKHFVVCSPFTARDECKLVVGPDDCHPEE